MRTGPGNRPQTEADRQAIETLIRLVRERPGSTGPQLWRKLSDRPLNWDGPWDATGPLLAAALDGEIAMTESDSDRAGLATWKFYPLGHALPGKRSRKKEAIHG